MIICYVRDIENVGVSQIWASSFINYFLCFVFYILCWKHFECIGDPR